MDESYVGIEELAKHFKVSVSTVRSWVRQGILPADTYLKVGKTYRFRKSAIEAALHKRQLDEVAKSAGKNANPDNDM